MSIAVPKPKGEYPSSVPPAGGHGGGTLSDTLPASALALVVSNASGNHKAGAAVLAEAQAAQNAEYNKYWERQQQQQQQQYWSQYAAWNQYNQSAAAHHHATAAGGPHTSAPPPHG